MQDADQSEKTARGGKVGLDLAVEPFDEQFGRFVVNAAPRHVDGFDLPRRRLANRLVITFADGKIFADGTAEPAQPQHHRFEMRAGLVGDFEQKPPVAHRNTQLVWTLMAGGESPDRPEDVVLDQVEDSYPAFLLDIRVAPQDGRLVQFDMRDARVRHDAMALYAFAARASKPERTHPQAVD